MAHRFGAFSVPDSHVSFLSQHHNLVHDYLEGVRPNGEIADQLPSDWPAQPLESLGSWSINHRNVDLYHWILNGGPELASGGGSIFQTWYEPDQHSALKLDKYNERFAFHANQLVELAATTAIAGNHHRAVRELLAPNRLGHHPGIGQRGSHRRIPGVGQPVDA